MNFIPGHPTQTMAAILLFALAVFTLTMAGLLSTAFFGLAVVLSGLTPLCVGVGLIADKPGLISWGNHASSSHGWLLFFGLLMFAVAGAIQLGGWRWTLRIQN